MKSRFLIALLCFCGWAAAQQAPAFRKLSPALYTQLKGEAGSRLVAVSVSLVDADTTLIKTFRLRQISKEAKVYTTVIRGDELKALSASPAVRFINQSLQPKEEINTGSVDYTLNRVNKAHHAFPTITGEAINVGVKERQFDSTDIDFKGRTFTTGLQAPQQTTHAALMATIIGGAGNTSPYAKGVATAVNLGSLDFANLFPEATAFYRQKGITIVNYSYGTAVENFYGNEAAAFDASALSNPNLLQVFSAGNSGTATPPSGIYTGLSGVANLTGNFKQAKNTITVAALDSSGAAMMAASKGPSFDGRLKPELAAYGEDGSSGAAALVSGTAALVQQAYKRQNGQLPPAHLTKAVLINSASDVATKGIDYNTGYGSLNTYKAVETVVQNRVLQGSVVQGETKTFPLTVPTGMAQLKLTVCWADTTATQGSATALVNNIDAVLVNTTTGERWLPWVLNPAPVKDSLAQLPQRKRDTLNNVEQISVEVPTAGNYQLQIKGERISTATQAFAIAYQLDTANRFAWDYPVGDNALVAANKHLLRWSTTYSGSGDVAYSYNGTSWQAIASGVALSSSLTAWQTPDTTAALRLRMTINGQSFLSDTIVLNKSINLSVGYNCADSFLLYWNKLSASGYRLYRLGEKYLEPVTVRTDTAIALNKAQHPSLYYAVAPIVNNREGLRSTTVLYPATGVGCYLVSFYLQTQTTTTASFVAELGTLTGLRLVELQKQMGADFVTVQRLSTLSAVNIVLVDTDLRQGESRYRLRLVLQNGTVIFSPVEKVYNLAGSKVYVYPNPVRQSEAVRIISTEPGRYTIRIINMAGVEVYQQAINNSYLTIAANRLPAGLYAVWVMDNQGKPTIQKLLVQ